MQNLDSYPKRKLKIPTQVQISVFSPRKQEVVLRDKIVCPLYEQIPEKIQPLIEQGQGDPSEMYAFVVDHVISNLKLLFLIAMLSFNITVQETPGAFGKSVLLISDLFKETNA